MCFTRVFILAFCPQSKGLTRFGLGLPTLCDAFAIAIVKVSIYIPDSFQMDAIATEASNRSGAEIPGTAPARPCASADENPLLGPPWQAVYYRLLFDTRVEQEVRGSRLALFSPNGAEISSPGFARSGYPGSGDPICPVNPNGVAPRRTTATPWGWYFNGRITQGRRCTPTLGFTPRAP